MSGVQRDAVVFARDLNLSLSVMALFLLMILTSLSLLTGTSVTKVTATDADDPVYGNSARLVYSILQGQPYFSIDPNTGEWVAVETISHLQSRQILHPGTAHHSTQKKVIHY